MKLLQLVLAALAFARIQGSHVQQCNTASLQTDYVATLKSIGHDGSECNLGTIRGSNCYHHSGDWNEFGQKCRDVVGGFVSMLSNSMCACPTGPTAVDLDMKTRLMSHDSPPRCKTWNSESPMLLSISSQPVYYYQGSDGQYLVYQPQQEQQYIPAYMPGSTCYACPPVQCGHSCSSGCHSGGHYHKHHKKHHHHHHHHHDHDHDHHNKCGCGCRSGMPCYKGCECGECSHHKEHKEHKDHKEHHKHHKKHDKKDDGEEPTVITEVE